MLINEKDAKNVLNLLLALGNFLYASESNQSTAKDMDMVTNVNEVNVSEGQKEELGLIGEIKEYLKTLLK